MKIWLEMFAFFAMSWTVIEGTIAIVGHHKAQCWSWWAVVFVWSMKTKMKEWCLVYDQNQGSISVAVSKLKLFFAETDLFINF